jgi:hypothetical protein
MKETEYKKQDTRIELSVKQQKQIEHQLIGQIVPKEGHRIWEVNKETLEVKEAEFSNITYKMFGDNKKEIIVKDGFAYIAALNKKNALKQYAKGSNGGRKPGIMSLPY